VADGAELLDDVHEFLDRFVAYPSQHARVAHALWIAHTHAMDAWESTPRLAFLSPEPGSGKTRALEITETLVPRPIETVNASSAAIFRKVSDPDGSPTLLWDEIDTLFGPRAKENEDIRGFLNAGHRRGATSLRCVAHGKEIIVVKMPAYCAVALAGLGNLPDTILTRSIIVRMRRRAPGERVEPYRRRDHAGEGHALRDRLAVWMGSLSNLESMRPEMPAGIDDRDADCWEALLAIADAAGGSWPERGRVAAVALVALSKAVIPSLGVKLLSDVRQVFGDQHAMFTTEVIDRLVALEESPWGDLKGKPLDARRLSNLLKPYGVIPQDVRIGNQVRKGYRREDLHDPWSRYLSHASATSATGATNAAFQDAPGPLEVNP
jgi:hypothetical protein